MSTKKQQAKRQQECVVCSTAEKPGITFFRSLYQIADGTGDRHFCLRHLKAAITVMEIFRGCLDPDEELVIYLVRKEEPVAQIFPPESGWVAPEKLARGLADGSYAGFVPSKVLAWYTPELVSECTHCHKQHSVFQCPRCYVGSPLGYGGKWIPVTAASIRVQEQVEHVEPGKHVLRCRTCGIQFWPLSVDPDEKRA